MPHGIGNIKRIDAILEEPNCDFPALVRIECADLSKHIAEQTAKIDAKTIAAKEMAATAKAIRRLQTMPGSAPLPLSRQRHSPQRCRTSNVGVILPHRLGLCPGEIHRAARSDWGTFPRRVNPISGACSSSERCQVELDGRKKVTDGSWLIRILTRKPRMLVASALANKMARGI